MIVHDINMQELQHPSEHLTDNYKKDNESNNWKLLDLSHQEQKEIMRNLRLIEAWRDVDNAEGFTLDKMGKNFLELREGRSDPEYRKAIKIKIRGNLSAGLVEDFNVIAGILFEDNYEGISETWNDPLFDYEPAGVSLSVSNITLEQQANWNYIRNLLEHIVKAGGVRLFWDLYWKIETVIEISVKVQFCTFNMPLTNKEITGTYPSRVYDGDISRGGMEIKTEGNAFTFETDISGTKPYPTHLPYMAGSDIEIQTNLKGHDFNIPIADAELTGTWPSRAKKGNITKGKIETRPTAAAYNYESDITGTLPQVQTKGKPRHDTISPKVEVRGLGFSVKLCGTTTLGGRKI